MGSPGRRRLPRACSSSLRLSRRWQLLSEIPAGPHRTPGRREIRLAGHLDSRWAAWSDGLSRISGGDRTAIFDGPVPGPAALPGLLQNARGLGLPLISVTQVQPGQPGCPAIEAR